jgi:GT2 family glycosyltransferase
MAAVAWKKKRESSVKISFIVLTYNRADALLAVLHSLARQCNSSLSHHRRRPTAKQVQMLFDSARRFECR